MSADRIADAARVLLATAQHNGWWVTPDGRMGLEDAAKLLGLSPKYLRGLCGEGRGPAHYHLGGRGHRITIGLVDLAAWRESKRNDCC